MELESPELVSAELREGAPAALRGGRCRACEYVFFPPYSYGCERCGAGGEALEPAELAAAGQVRAAVCVHRTRGGTPEGVAEIALGDGPTLRGVLLVADPLPGPGTAVRGVVVTHPRKPDLMALRFAVED